MSKTKKSKTLRRNVRDFNDSDFIGDLPPAEKKYYEQFLSEYYNNELNNDGSIHKKALSPEDFERAKKETYAATHAQNRDLFGISNTAYLVSQFEEDFINVDVSEDKKDIRYRLKKENPGIIMDSIINEAIADLELEDIDTEKRFILKNLIKQSLTLVQVVRTEKKAGRLKQDF